MDLPIRPMTIREALATHTLYKTGDPDAPEQITDRNNHVALAMCRHCGRAEIELEEPCDKEGS